MQARDAIIDYIWKKVCIHIFRIYMIYREKMIALNKKCPSREIVCWHVNVDNSNNTFNIKECIKVDSFYIIKRVQSSGDILRMKSIQVKVNLLFATHRLKAINRKTIGKNKSTSRKIKRKKTEPFSNLFKRRNGRVCYQKLLNLFDRFKNFS